MKKHLKTARLFAKLLDNQFSFLGIKFGLDPILDLIPGAGDIAGALLSLYLVWIGLQMELPVDQIRKMIWHIFVDFIVGIIPIVGAVGDIFYKANIKNLEVLERFSEKIIDGEIVD